MPSPASPCLYLLRLHLNLEIMIMTNRLKPREKLNALLIVINSIEVYVKTIFCSVAFGLQFGFWNFSDIGIVYLVCPLTRFNCPVTLGIILLCFEFVAINISELSLQ